MSKPVVQREDKAPQMRALPTDEVRQVMWRVADRPELEKLVQSNRSAASALMTAARLLSAVAPILRYQSRADVRRAETHEDVMCRLIDVWATGEAAASLGLAALRQVDAGENQCGADMLSLSAKLWTSVQGAAAMRDASQLLGGQALEDDGCSLLPQGLLDAQCEAAGAEDESLLRYQLSKVMMDETCLDRLRRWMGEMKKIAALRGDTGACAVGSALDLWLWTVEHFQKLTSQDGDADDPDLRRNVGPLADALGWLLAARFQILDVLQLISRGPDNPRLAAHLPGTSHFLSNLCHVQSARAAGEVGRICAELVFGYTLHPTWDPACDACLQAEEIDALEAVMPGISYGARLTGDVMEQDGSHPDKAGPCVRPDRFQGFVNRRGKLDGCMSGARLAREQAAAALAGVAI